MLKKEGLLFLLAVFFESIFIAALMQQHRVPAGHDGFQYFTLQYYFLNNAVNYGEIPQWIPFMTHGSIATIWYGIQAGILQNILVFTGRLLAKLNFVQIFHIGMFIDELLLMIGVWLLGKRFFHSLFTVFFVTVTAVGSCIWFTQAWWNFHFYYAIPLILYFMHSFFDSGKWIYCFLAGNLLLMQMLGNLPYFIAVTSLVIFLYFLFYWVFNFNAFQGSIKVIKWNRFSTVCIFLIIVSFVMVNMALRMGTREICAYNFGRGIHFLTDLKIFLSYGGNLGLAKWIELFLRVSPRTKDYTLYIGFLSLFLIIIGAVYNLNRKNLHFLFLILTLLLFSMGTFVSTFFYYTWPFMKYFRHLYLVSPIIKLFLCFIAGFGFELLVSRRRRKNIFEGRRVWISAIFSTLMLFLSVILFLNLSSFVHLIVKIVNQPFPISENISKNIFSSGDVLKIRLILVAFFAFAMALSILVIIFPDVNRRNSKISILGIVLFFQLVDIYSYKTFQKDIGTIVFDNDKYKTTNFTLMPYAKRRDTSSWDNNPRASVFLNQRSPSQKYAICDAIYGTTYAFLFKDQLNSDLPTEQWLRPLDKFMRAYGGQSISDESIKPTGLFYYKRLDFPSNHPAALKIAGMNEDKVQFFSDAYVINSDVSIAAKITDSNYSGDILFLSDSENNKNKDHNNLTSSFDRPLSSNMRLHIPYVIRRFDSNNVEIEVDVQDQRGAWLLYSDVWHPFWKATINEKSVDVYRANLAYKAVKLNYGPNKLHFYFNSKTLSSLQFFFGLNSLLWLGTLIWLAMGIYIGK